jgi:hypothetical protein
MRDYSVSQNFDTRFGGRYPGSIHTFGFGYNLQSEDLIGISNEGQGMYSFIPDAGFVGTIFVNAISNHLVSCAANAILQVHVSNSDEVSIKHIYGEQNYTSDGRTITWNAGNIQFEQRRDFVITLSYANMIRPPPAVLSTAFSTLTDSSELAEYSSENISNRADLDSEATKTDGCLVTATLEFNSFFQPYGHQVVNKRIPNNDVYEITLIDIQKLRSEFVELLHNCNPSSLNAIHVLESRMDEWLADHAKIGSRANSSNRRVSNKYALGYTAVKSLSEDLKGQVKEVTLINFIICY